jgi:predicted secreted protein
LISDPWADVWELTEQDSGCLLEASQHDVFAVRLYDNSSAGFLWELDDLGPDCDVVKDTTEDLGERLGVPAARTVFLKYREPGFHRLHFAHRRPWSGQVAAHIDLTLDNHGKETVGLPRKTKLRALGVAA